MTAQEKALKILEEGKYGKVEFGKKMWPIYASMNTDHMVAKRAGPFLEELQGRGLVYSERGKYGAV